jgi:pimeloyl-ACP methyl ester carboxylesterase
MRSISAYASLRSVEGSLHEVELFDGRVLEVYASGPTEGVALVFQHGTPGHALPLRVIERAVHARGLQFVTTSRPGYGASTPRPERQVVDVVEDTQAILTYLGIDRCLVAGWSGGGPHALASAARLRGVKGALIIAGVAPSSAEGLDWMAGMGEDNVVEFGAAIEGAHRLRPYLEKASDEMKDVTVEALISSMDSLLPDVDRAVLTDEFGEDLLTSFREGLRIGVDGWLEDDLAFVTPWGFDLEEIRVPTMVWQGSEDLMVPFDHGRWLAAHIPDALVHLEMGEGHLSIGIGAIDRMLEELASAITW